MHALLFRYQKNSNLIDTSLHTRIWLSPDPDVFMNSENVLRTVRFQHQNPDKTLSLIYSSQLLSEKGLIQKNLFQTQFYNIQLIDFDDDLERLCTTKNDRILYEYAREEIRHMASKQGGNPGSASDLIRYLTPVVEMGTYSDFDTIICTKNLLRFVSIKEGFIGNVSSVIPSKNDLADKEYIKISNDIIAFARDSSGKISAKGREALTIMQDFAIQAHKETLPWLLKARGSPAITNILKKSSIPIVHNSLSPIRLRYMLSHLEQSCYMILKFFLEIRLDTPPSLAALMIGKERMQKLFEDFADPLRIDFSNAISEQDKDHILRSFIFAELQQESQILEEIPLLEKQIAEIAKKDRAVVKKKLLMLYNRREKIQNITYLTEDKKYHEAMHHILSGFSKSGETTISDILIKSSVIMISGPYIFNQTLRSLYESYRQKTPDIDRITHGKKFAFQEHDVLKTAYVSPNSVPFHSHPEHEYEKNLQNTTPLCDGSWLSFGQASQKKREDAYEKSAQKIQKFMKRKIQKTP